MSGKQAEKDSSPEDAKPTRLRDLGIPEVARQQVSPLFVLLESMRTKWVALDLDGAAALAKAAAPYVHARVPAARPIEDLSEVSDAQLEALANHLRACAEEQDPGEPA